MTTWTGTLPTLDLVAAGTIFAADIATMNSALAALTDAWTDYSGSVGWTSGGTPPAIGNGSITAAYLQSGKLVMCAGRIVAGTTTTFGGANAWQINLPVTAASQNYTGSAYFNDASTTANKTPGAILPGLTTVSFSSITGPVSATVPYTWAVSDYLAWAVTYQAA